MKINVAGKLSAIAACIACSLAGAQQLDEVVVEAAPIVKNAVGGGPAPGYYKVAMSSRVSYADLDLSKPDDVAKLEQRIKEAATEVCNALGKPRLQDAIAAAKR